MNINIRFFLTTVLFCFQCQALNAGPLSMAVAYKLEQQTLLKSDHHTQQGWFEQRLDHEHPESGVFKQRFYTNEQFSQQPDDPVFFYICGEASCSENSLNGAIRTYAKKYHAKLVALEHRYYGQSIPFDTLSPENLKLLSTEQALADLAYFQRRIASEHNWTGRWIAFGGSYPGSLSAYYRMKYPYLVKGALASSAPVEAVEDFVAYDAHVTKEAGPLCAQKMREVVQAAESALENPERALAFKTRFHAEMLSNDDDFLYLLADVGATAVQYGMKQSFCQDLTQNPDPIEAYAAFTKKILDWLHISAIDMTFEGAISENASRYAQGVGMRQWMWQSCTEYGYWQNAHPNAEQSTRSQRINLAYHHQACQRMFQRQQPADTLHMNQLFYRPLLDEFTSHIFLTNGSQDPWSNLSMTRENGHDSNPMLEYMTISGTAHCDDLRPPRIDDVPELKAARHKTEQLIQLWLTQ